ncbi:MAG: hypothetical protein KDI44_16545 [Thiothrix sp.]|nr:hypothetical protein [Thiothrix sp.]
MSDFKVLEFSRRKQEPDPVVVERMRDLLEMAERGEIVNLFVVAALADDSVLSGGWGKEKPFVMLGGIEAAKRDFMENCIEFSA